MQLERDNSVDMSWLYVKTPNNYTATGFSESQILQYNRLNVNKISEHFYMTNILGTIQL